MHILQHVAETVGNGYLKTMCNYNKKIVIAVRGAKGEWQEIIDCDQEILGEVEINEIVTYPFSSAIKINNNAAIKKYYELRGK